MNRVNTPIKLAKKERTTTVPQREYMAFLSWQKKMSAEMKGIDEAITVAKNEKINGKLKLARSFSAILKPAR